MLTMRPLATKVVTTGLLSGLGDIVCQKFEGRGLCFKRTATFAAVGSIYIGPLLHLNYSKMLPYPVPACAKTS